MRIRLGSLLIVYVLLTPGAQGQQGVVNDAGTDKVTISLSEQEWQIISKSAEKVIALDGLQSSDEWSGKQVDELRKLVRLLWDPLAQGVRGSTGISPLPISQPSRGWRRPTETDGSDCSKLLDSINVLNEEISRLKVGD